MAFVATACGGDRPNGQLVVVLQISGMPHGTCVKQGSPILRCPNLIGKKEADFIQTRDNDLFKMFKTS
jgi:hypothetical protein